MKKLLLALVLVLSMISASAQVKYYRSITHRVCIGQDCSKWDPSNIKMAWDFTNSQLVIYSKKTQIIDYKYWKTESSPGYKTYYMSGTDSNYQSITIILVAFPNNDAFVSIHYPEFYYVYEIVEIPETDW